MGGSPGGEADRGMPAGCLMDATLAIAAVLDKNHVDYSAPSEEFADRLMRVCRSVANRILPSGCYALVDPCETVERPGKPYAVCVNGCDATIKRVRPLANGYELSPDSTDPTFKPVVYDYGVEGTDEITVIGEVVWHCIPAGWQY